MKFKTKSIKTWCELLGVEIVDNDGFPGLSLDASMPIHSFLDGITICTINPIDKEKYKILDFLIKNM